MRENNIFDATVYHNNTNGTCGYCNTKEPQYWSMYGLGSYGIIGKEVQKSIKALRALENSGK